MTLFAIRSCEAWNGPVIVFHQQDFERLKSSASSTKNATDGEEGASPRPFEYQECTDMDSAIDFLSKTHPALATTAQVVPATNIATAAAAAVTKNCTTSTATTATTAAPLATKRKSKKSKLSVASTSSLRWNERFQELFRYKMQHGHCNVSAKSTDADTKKLGEWVRTQRRRKNGSGAKFLKPLTQEEEGKLNVIGFDWRCPSKPEWDVRYQQLAKFKQIYGHCQVPRDYADNTALGIWCVTQRKRKRQKTAREPDHVNLSGCNLLVAVDDDAIHNNENKPKRPSPMTGEQETKLLVLGFEF